MKKAILAVITAGIILASCSDNVATNSLSGSKQDGVYNYRHPGLIHDQKAIDKAFAGLRSMDKYKGEKIKVFQNMQFYDDRIEIEISDPLKPLNIDHYTFSDGKWSAPEPVQLSGNGGEDINDNLTALDSIAMEKIADMAKIADEKAKTMEGGKPCKYIGFLLDVSYQRRQFITQIEGTRERVALTFNAGGTLTQNK